MDKSSVRKSLLEQRYNLAAKSQKAEQLQQALRIWLLSRPDTVIGAYWPIKGEFDPLPALYRWQEDGVLNKNRPPGTANENSVTALLNKIETKITDPAFQDEAAAGKAADILDAAAGSPRKIGLPVINKVHKTLTFHAWYPGCPMEEDAYKIPKPKDTELLFKSNMLDSNRFTAKIKASEIKENQKRIKKALISDSKIKEQFGIKAPCAILSKLAGCIDPYRMASRLLLRLAERGGRVFDRTVIASIKPTANKVTLRTPEGHQIHTKHLVMAAGYASQKWLKQPVAKNRSSYAFITDPMAAEDLGWLASTMAWESARPYLYMRTTGDNRLLVGGDDDDTDIPARRDKRVESKAKGLVKKVEKLLPQLTLRPAFSWGGTFAETEDGLPFFGEHPQWGPRVLFAMAYGGNGISYSMIGAGLLRATIEGRSHPLAPLFGFSRLD